MILTSNNYTTSKKKHSVHAEDIRPREEYDEPWEWSQTHSMILDQIGHGGETCAQTRNTPLMTKRGNLSNADVKVTMGLAEVVAEAEASLSNLSLLATAENIQLGQSKKENEIDKEENCGEDREDEHEKLTRRLQEQEDDKYLAQTVDQQQWYKEETEPIEKKLVTLNSKIIVETGQDEEEIIEVEYENIKDDYDKPEAPQDFEEEEYERYTHLRDEFPKIQNCPENDQRIDNYEEPWDLTSTQKDLEDRIKAHVSCTEPTLIVSSDTDLASAQPLKEMPKTIHTAEIVCDAASSIPCSDTRAQDGYEKPWDWKPHKKDDRGHDGYEKPWDWKPHQKDDRPQEEYEQPWDHKAQRIEQNIINAKGAKDLSLTPSGEVEMIVVKKNNDDSRPTEEYDEPWDQKRKNKEVEIRTGQ